MTDWDTAATRLGLFADVLPRAVASARAAGQGDLAAGLPASTFGPRTVTEAALDEFFIAVNAAVRHMPSTVDVSASIDRCATVADEIAGLGIAGANVAQPVPEIVGRRRKVFGATGYHHIDFRADIRLPGSLAELDPYEASTASVRVLASGTARRPWLIWVHGAAQGRPDDLYAFRAAHLHRRLGYNVVFPVLPAHGVRRHRSLAYPGLDPLTNVSVTLRAIAEVRALVSWIATHDPSEISIVGTSLGGPVAAMVAGLEDQIGSVLAVVPMLDMHATLAHHMSRGGSRGAAMAILMRSPAVRAVSSVIDPLGVEPAAVPDRRMVIGALNDRVTSVAAARRLHAHWGGRVHWYRGSHVGQAFSANVRTVTDRFLRLAPPA
ncbi:alpha/beta hydrolase family protein [Gordonia rhizosphera]|uniref:AB hydrolase-1 domain-containing protein n=1 Tax=Gordonia rhizosphera NBRC 16068 TaxID=1108045 RepID=K6X1H1_9ACTN|nr:alpha/beta hydrolase family protein [Gordonia rhizosphera]GAB92654.1 hypothetical protein GORHZ_186_00240 [Gordonia rhizosphera NBRC 16068]